MYGWGLALGLLLASLLVLDNRHLLLETPLHEGGDSASNSLFVREAKSGAVIHGHYSRWDFYHPGPVLFYVYALGESVFYDWLHAVPTPYNGQIISSCLAVTVLFSLALAVFAQRLGAQRGGAAFFLPLALFFAAWHYGAAARLAPAFVATWPACPLILVFLCFVVAASSVAAGGGRELPLLAFTGGWLVHNYVAQPLFVVPMAALAYGSLLVRHRSATWRQFPRAHLIAAGILAVFILPLLIDVTHGNESNFSRILAHLRRHHEPLHKLARSFCYFVTFGGYDQYDPVQDFFGRYTVGGMMAFIGRHARAYLGWTAALVGTPLLSALVRKRQGDGFLRWFGVMAATAFVLTLLWGMRQDGEMFYFNAYFNYSIYFCAALGLAAALSMCLQAWIAAPGRAVISAALVGSVGIAFWWEAASFENLGVVEPGGDALVALTAQTAEATLHPGQVCYVDWHGWDGWGTATGTVLELDRLGYRPRVNDNWKTMFGHRRAFSWEDAYSDEVVGHWRIVPAVAGYGVEALPLADLEPDGGMIHFSADGNWGCYACGGWAPSGETSWADQPCGLLQFHPLPLPTEGAAGVDLLIDGWSLTATAQRVEVFFDGTPLPTVSLPLRLGDEPAKVRIAAEQWRAAAGRGVAKVAFRFLDARSPYELGMNNDERKLGGGFRRVEFRVAR